MNRIILVQIHDVQLIVSQVQNKRVDQQRENSAKRSFILAFLLLQGKLIREAEHVDGD